MIQVKTNTQDVTFTIIEDLDIYCNILHLICMLYLVVHLLMNLAIVEKKIQLSLKRTSLYITLHMSSDDYC